MMYVKYALMFAILINNFIAIHKYDKGEIQFKDTIMPFIMATLLVVILVERNFF